MAVVEVEAGRTGRELVRERLPRLDDLEDAVHVGGVDTVEVDRVRMLAAVRELDTQRVSLRHPDDRARNGAVVRPGGERDALRDLDLRVDARSARSRSPNRTPVDTGARLAHRGLPAPAPLRRSWRRGPWRRDRARGASPPARPQTPPSRAARASRAGPRRAQAPLRSGVDAASLSISPCLKITRSGDAPVDCVACRRHTSSGSGATTSDRSATSPTSGRRGSRAGSAPRSNGFPSTCTPSTRPTGSPARS